jgi:hypothetical protein
MRMRHGRRVAKAGEKRKHTQSYAVIRHKTGGERKRLESEIKTKWK